MLHARCMPRNLLRCPNLSPLLVTRRSASIFSAIEKGRANSRDFGHGVERRVRRSRAQDHWKSTSVPLARNSERRAGPRRNGLEKTTPRDDAVAQPKTLSPLPYTTAASEFLYGNSVVYSALKAGRRKLYNLYVHERAKYQGNNLVVRTRARRAGVRIHEFGDEKLPLLDKASGGRPHNVSDGVGSLSSILTLLGLNIGSIPPSSTTTHFDERIRH